MRNIRLTIAYDGTDFHGWQIQPGVPTIQGQLVEIARRITQESELMVHGAGRTDAGVHASGQVAHFHTQSRMTPAEFQRAFNSLLPPEIRILGAEETVIEFHSRFSAISKGYCYRIFRGRVVPPFIHRQVLHYPGPLDEAAMMAAAPLFVGEHDFTFFSAAQGGDDDDEPSPVRTITHSDVLRIGIGNWRDVPDDTEPEPEDSYELAYSVAGRSFLRYMVRKIAGTLLEVGRGKLRHSDIPGLFEIRDRTRTAVTLPPQGLCLEGVEYDELPRYLR